VDREAGVVRLNPGTTKNGEGRLLFLSDELRAIIDEQWIHHQSLHPACDFVFHRDSKQILDIRGAWDSACKEAKLAGKISHDLRRAAVRNMVCAGISERVAMQLSGHKTRDVFDRYNIVSEGDLREAARRMSEAMRTRNGHSFGHKFKPGRWRNARRSANTLILLQAGMAELVDAPDSKSGSRKAVGVRVPLPAVVNLGS